MIRLGIASGGTCQAGPVKAVRAVRMRSSVVKQQLALGRAIKKALRKDEAFEILDASKGRGGSWTEGGCLILAYALLDMMPSSVMIRVEQGHFAVRYSGFIWDGDGCVGERNYDVIYGRREGLTGVRHCIVADANRPYEGSEWNEGDIPYDLDASRKVADYLRRELEAQGLAIR